MFWYEDEVKRVEKVRAELSYNPEVLFYGSSTFNLWDNLEESFRSYKPVNLAFGGSTIAACSWFFERIVKGYDAIKAVVIYAGDNDLGDNRHPEEVYICFFQLVTQIRERFGDIPVVYVSIKPSPRRWNIDEQIEYTNMIIEREIGKRGGNLHFVEIHDLILGENGKPNEQLFMEDGLHLNAKGHDIMKEQIGKKLAEVLG
jgi:lysophospholipase L1-like esterase